MSDPTLYQALARAGLESNPCDLEGKRIIKDSDGNIFGVFSAKEAWHFLSVRSQATNQERIK